MAKPTSNLSIPLGFTGGTGIPSFTPATSFDTGNPAFSLAGNGAADFFMPTSQAASFSATAQRTELSNRLRSLLKCYFPLALRILGETLHTKMACEFLLKWPSLEHLQRAREQTGLSRVLRSN